MGQRNGKRRIDDEAITSTDDAATVAGIGVLPAILYAWTTARVFRGERTRDTRARTRDGSFVGRSTEVGHGRA